jgi:8-oxo-dGTP pyrophosphatase MutT (NUDIX family)
MRERINKLGFTIAKPFARWKLAGSTRVRALLVFEDEILLNRAWIGSQRWSLPGGGVNKDEKPKKALKRELIEELDISIPQKKYHRILKHHHTDHGADHLVILYQINMGSRREFKVNKHEIIEAAWHKIDDLPDETHPLVFEALKHRK